MKKIEIDKNEVMDKLKEVSLFKFLSEDEINYIISDSEVFEYEKDEDIISSEYKNVNLYIILSGYVNVTVSTVDGEIKKYVCSIGENDIFGEAGLFLNSKSMANISAYETLRVLAIENAKIIDFIEKNPESGNKFLILLYCRLSERLANTNQELAAAKKFEFNQMKIDKLVLEYLSK